MKQISKNVYKHQKQEVVVYACIRNEYERLPYFFQHYINLGVKKFVIIDNNSDDGSTQYLLERSDCYVFWTDQNYADSRCGINWLNQLLSTYSINKWSIVVDADELLIYSDYESKSIMQLTQFLDDNQATALKTFMLDMYAKGPIKDAIYTRGQAFLEICPYFDSDSYTSLTGDGLPLRGGVRKRLFWDNHQKNRGKPPVLTKIPLIKWKHNFELEASTHVLNNANFSKQTGVILHFKLFSDFYKLAEQEANRGQHWDQGAQYEAYWKTLNKQANLDPMYEGSVKFINSQQLVQLGLILGACPRIENLLRKS